ncbi:MAG: alpha-galactosidase, partial [Verrucomicrobiota bacterium]
MRTSPIGRIAALLLLAALGALGPVVAGAPGPGHLRRELGVADLPPAGSGPTRAAWREGLGQWLGENLRRGAAPFSFTYDGRTSGEWLPGWRFSEAREELDAGRSRRTTTYLDPRTGLEVRCEAVLFRDHPAVEWVVRIRNTADRETPLLEDLQALDTTLRDPQDTFTLHHAQGVQEGIDARPDDFRPVSRGLAPGETLKMGPRHGRSSWGDSLPFFNVEMGEPRGVIVGVGWTGQWQAAWDRGPQTLRLRAGMERTRLKLHPGEEIRSPRILLLFWQGHRLHGQNLLRRMLRAHYHPQQAGRPVRMPFLASSAGLYREAFRATEANQLDYARQFSRLGVEYLWMDVGWFDPQVANSHNGPIDRQRFPRGFRPLTDALRGMNMGLLLWFAPEYPGGGSWLDLSFPGYFLRLKGQPQGIGLYNLGDRNAWEMLLQHTSSLITREGLGIYRIDGPLGANCPYPQKQPLAWWRDNDPPDRQGITEIRYIEGLYAFWDELLRRHPGLIIDLCGGGATRLDLEAMSRCLYLWRSDSDHPGFEPDGEQARNYGASLWTLSTATGCGYPETYSFRSSLNEGVALCWNPYQPTVAQDWPLAHPVRQKAPHQARQVPRQTVSDLRQGYTVSEPFPWDSAERLAAE